MSNLMYHGLQFKCYCRCDNKLKLLDQLMKNTTNLYDLKKVRPAQPSKKSNFLSSIIYKEIAVHPTDNNSKVKNNRQSKQTILSKERKPKEEERGMTSKKNSFNQLLKKSSKVDLSNLDLQHIYGKLTDNYLVDTQQQTRFQPEDTKHLISQKAKRDPKDNNVSDLIKKNVKNTKLTLENIENYKVQKSHFNYTFIIGKGGFGKVWKVEHKKTKNQFAMKEMLKSIVMTKKSVQSVMNQRVLLSQINSPFIVNMHFAFQDRDTLYLVLDLMEGGDLRYHIGNRVFNEIQCKFFMACIILGLQELQNNNIIHRDIKPENLVLDSRGYIRITDLGIARTYKPNNSCDTSGTPGYMSPEVICRMNHSFVSDYFALGVIAYELMTGRRPYNGRSRNQIRDLMLAKQVQLKYNDIPEEWSFEAADFINKLIQRKPQNRLGFNGITQIKSHPWLAGLNWQKLKSKDIESPFIPMMKKSNFDQDEQITIEDEEQAELIEKNSLLLRKPEFQQLFKSYYFSSNQANCPINNEPKQKKSSAKRVISAYRKSSQQQKQTRIYQMIPEKKMSNNDINNKRKIDVQTRIDKSRQFDLLADHLIKDKKRSAQFEKTFFR